MALVTGPCISLASGFTMTITFDDVTELVSSLTISNPSSEAVTVTFSVGTRTGSLTVQPGQTSVTMVPPGRAPRAGETVSISVV